jgi:hypothetical protein
LILYTNTAGKNSCAIKDLFASASPNYSCITKVCLRSGAARFAKVPFHNFQINVLKKNKLTGAMNILISGAKSMFAFRLSLQQRQQQQQEQQ